MKSETVTEFAWSEKHAKLREFSERYHRLTESYDRTVCTGQIINGEIHPATARQAALTHINAKHVMRDLVRQANPHGITEAELKEAIFRHRNSG